MRLTDLRDPSRLAEEISWRAALHNQELEAAGAGAIDVARVVEDITGAAPAPKPEAKPEAKPAAKAAAKAKPLAKAATKTKE